MLQAIYNTEIYNADIITLNSNKTIYMLVLAV